MLFRHKYLRCISSLEKHGPSSEWTWLGRRHCHTIDCRFIWRCRRSERQASHFSCGGGFALFGLDHCFRRNQSGFGESFELSAANSDLVALLIVVVPSCHRCCLLLGVSTLSLPRLPENIGLERIRRFARIPIWG